MSETEKKDKALNEEKKSLFKNKEKERVSRLEKKAAELAKEDDEETKAAKILKTMPKWRYWTIAALAVFFTVFQLYIKLITPLDSWFQMPMHICLALAILFLFHPLSDKYHKTWLWVIDAALVACTVFIAYYYISNVTFFDFRVFSIDPMRIIDLVAGVMLIIIVLEAVRRCVSTMLFGVLLFAIAYAFFGQHISGVFHYSGMTWKQLVETLTLGQNGIFGSALITSVGTLFYFMIFGTFFANTGGGQVLIDLGMKLSDKTVGGPAKASVVSSGLMGMISGSAVANVSTTGVLTIPLMKKSGYRPEEAAAVESVASTGGQIMPPIMGAGAFIMAEMIGVKYTQIATSAIIPAICYYAATFMVVHLLAKKRNMDAHVAGLKYECKPLLPRSYRLLPILVLVVMIFVGFSLPRSAIYCTLLSIAIGTLSKDTRKSIRQLLGCLIEGVRQASAVAIPTGACGIMIGIIVRSGVAVKIAKLIDSTGNSQLVFALIIAAMGCLLLGMALPTVAAFLIGNVLFCSSIQNLGVQALPANMFIFYFGVIAQITPPVCMASYTAAGIAGSSAWTTGWKAFTFAIPAFLVPFMFVYEPSVLLMGTVAKTVLQLFVILVGCFGLAIGISGYFRRDISPIIRTIFFVAAIATIIPEQITTIGGVVVTIAMCVFCILTAKKAAKVNAEA